MYAKRASEGQPMRELLTRTAQSRPSLLPSNHTDKKMLETLGKSNSAKNLNQRALSRENPFS